jgi:hypothetical protein
MTGSIALDVFIGLISIFLLYSLLASIIMEGLAKLMGLRAKITLKAVVKILDDSEFRSENVLSRSLSVLLNLKLGDRLKKRPLTALFYAHPNIKNLGSNALNRKPSAISPEMFADTLIQLLRGEEFRGQQNQIDLIKENLKLMTPNEGKINTPSWFKDNSNTYKPKILLGKNGAKDEVIINALTLYQFKQVIFDSHSDIDVFKQKLIAWYNETMERANGWYIKQTRSILFFIGLALACIFKIDAIFIAQKLANDKSARDKMIEFASKMKEGPAPDLSFIDTTKSKIAIDSAITKIQSGIDTSSEILGGKNGDYWFLGYVIFALAISLGAPFWFDLLGKIMSIRQTGAQGKAPTSNSTDQPIA